MTKSAFCDQRGFEWMVSIAVLVWFVEDGLDILRFD